MKAFFTFLLIGFSGLLTAQNWDLLTPIKTSDIVRNCSFLDSQNGYCVIQVDGQILKTVDGGLTWERPWTPGMSSNLYDIEMVSLDTIFSAGVNGEIFRSIDSGNSWIEMSTPTAQWLYALEFINSSVGFASGHTGVILKTTDGGTTWELKETNTTSRLYDIEFVNETLGFACGWNGTVLKSIDAGETWTQLETDHDGALFNCHFPSENVGYACGFTQSILKTDDGGETWNVQHEGSNTLNYIEFRDEDNGWAVGDWGAHFVTSNGGATWTSSNTTGDAFLWCGQYLDEETSFLMGKDVMYRSTDNTSNWELIKNAVPRAKYNGVFFQDDNTGYAAGSTGGFGEGSDQSGIIYTEDSGQIWDVQNFGFANGWWDIHFSSLSQGIAVGGDKIAVTSNGGDTWTTSTFPMDISSQAAWRFNNNEWLVGGLGLFSDLCKTTNAGSSYVCGTNLAAGDFSFVNDNIGYAVFEGSSENILKTINAGETWEYKPTGSFALKHSVFFLNENLGWVGLSNGGILKTTDGGDTWNTSFASNTIVGIHFYDEQIGFCANSSGDVFKSEDGGDNWTLFLSGINFTMPVAKEGFFTDNFLYLGCWGGDVYRCELGCGSITAGTIVADNEWCANTFGNVFISEYENYESFDWTLPEGWTTEEDDGIIQVISGTEGGLIEVTVTNGCGLSASAQLEVNILPEVEAIEGLTSIETVCPNASFTTEVINVQEDVTYYWTFSSNWSGVNDAGSIEITTDENPGWVQVYSENNCGTSEEFLLDITLDEIPEVTFELPFDEACSNLVINLDQGLPLGGVYTGEGVSDNILDLSLIDGDETSVTYTFTSESDCSVSITDAIIILDGSITGGVLEGPTTFCPETEIVFELEGIVGTDDYAWTYPPEWTIEELENVLNVTSASVSGTISVVASNSCGNEENFTLEVTALAVPQIPELISYEEDWCVDDLGTVVLELNDTEVIDVSNIGLDYSIEFFDNSYTIDYFGESGDYELGIATQNECGSSDTLYIDVTVNELPDVSLILEEDMCLENIYDVTVSPEGGVLTGDGVNDLSIETYFLNLDVIYTYSYTYTDDNGCSASDVVETSFLSCIGVDEILDNSIQVYPNPASEFFEIAIDFNSDLNYKALLSNSNGEIVKTINLTKGTNVIDLADLADGIYNLMILDLDSGALMFSERLLVLR